MAYSAGTAYLQIVPSFRGVERAIRKQAEDIGKQVDASVSKALPNGFAEGAKQARRHGEKAAEDYSGALGRTVRQRLDKAFKALPEVKINSDSSEVDRTVSRIRKHLGELRDQHINLDIDDATALREIRKISREIDRLDRKGFGTGPMRANLAAARRELLEVQKFADQANAEAGKELLRRQAELAKEAAKRARDEEKAAREQQRIDRERIRERQQADRQAEQQARRIATERARVDRQALRERVAAEREAQQRAERERGGFGRILAKQLDEAVGSLRPLDIDSSPAEQKLARLRERLQTLRDARVGIDIDAADAVAEIKAVQNELEKLARKNRKDIQIKADVLGAYTALESVRKIADRLDGRKVKLDLDLDKVGSGLENVGQKADVPLSRLGALISLGTALGPALVPGLAAAAVAAGALGTALIGATAGVGVVALSFVGIGDAVKALDDYTNDAAKSSKAFGQAENSVANAEQSVVSATRALRRAREDAAFSAKRSAQQVAAARRQESDAEKEAIKAQQALADAIADVRREEEDRTLQLKDNALAQRQANLDIADAKKELDKILANPRATAAEREQARITYEEKALQLEQLSVAGKRLQEEQAEANRKGVAGSDKVVAAQERIADTSQRVLDAQQNLSDALEDQRRSQRDAADSVLSATESLASAQRTLEQAYKSQAVAGGEAYQTLQQKLGSLSAEGQKFALFIFGLKDEMLGLRDAAADNFLPGLQSAIGSLLPKLPKIREYIADVATEMGNVATRTSQALLSPEWGRFFTFIRDNTVPVLKGLTTVTLNIAAGTRDLFLALTKFNAPIGKGLIQMTESFAKWAANLENSQGYKKFLAYVRDVGPDVLDFFVDLGKAIFNIVEAAAPVGAVVLKIVDALLEFIDAIPTGALTVVIGLLAVFAASTLLISGYLKTLAFAQDFARGAVEAYNKTLGKGITAFQNWRAAQASAIIGTGDYSRGLKVAEGSVDDISGALDRTTKRAAATGVEIEKLGGKTRGVAVAAGEAGEAMSGKFSLGLIAAGIALSYVISKHEEQVQRTKDNIRAFEELGQVIIKTGSIQSDQARNTILQSENLRGLYSDLQQSAKAAGDFDTRLSQVAATNGNFAQSSLLAARAADEYGTDLNTLARALVGNKTAQQQLLDTLARASDPQNNADAKLRAAAQARREELIKLFAQMDLQVEVEKALKEAVGDTSDTFADSSRGLQDYVKQLQVLTDNSASAAEKTDALRQAEDQMFGAQRTLQESLEAQAKALRERNELLSDETFLQKTGAKQLDIKTEAGARLTDALEAELTAINGTFRANIAAGKSVEEATKQHDNEIAALKEKYKQKGIDEAATQKLIDIYGQVPTSRVTDFATSHFDTTKQQLEELMAYQLALREGISLDAARERLHPQIKGGKGNSQNAGLATGGPVRGPGTKTSDSVPAYVPGSPVRFRLSDGEFVQQAAAVDHYGLDVMHAMNQRRVPKAMFRYFGYAAGGPVGGVDTYPFPATVENARIPSKDEVGRAVKQNLGPTGAGPGFLPWPSSPGAQRGDTGVWRSVLALVRASGIPYTFGNAYRPGDPLWHGSGRAVDFMGYNQDRLAQFFIDRLPQVLELIHLTPKGGYFVTRGKRKANFPVQGPLHRNHLHVAMAQGGQVKRLRTATYDIGGDLPPGYTLAYNGTGRNERVLTAQQVADMGLGRPGGNAGNQYHFQFRDTTLDAARLRAIQDREAAIARSGRAR